MKIINSIANVTKNIKHSLFSSQNEPIVKQKVNHDGSYYWQVRDRKTNRYYTFGSDTEVRIWIEERYHGV